MRASSASASFAAAAAVVLVAGRAVAAPEPRARTSSLAWVRSEGAESCVGSKELAEAVERILARRAFVSASAADVAIEGRVEPARPGWKATLRVSGEHGALLGGRELASPEADCRAMDAALAFVIAVMIDPDAVARPQAPLAPPPPAPGPSTPSPERSSAPPPTPSRWSLAPRAGVSFSIGQLPGAAWGPAVGLRVGPPAVGLELQGTLFVPQDTTIPGASGATVRVACATAGVAVCPTLARFGPGRVEACVGAAGAALTVTPGVGLSREQESTDFGVLAALRARLAWSFTRALYALTEAGADVPFERPRWTATTSGGATLPVFEPSAAAAVATVALGLAFE